MTRKFHVNKKKVNFYNTRRKVATHEFFILFHTLIVGVNYFNKSYHVLSMYHFNATYISNNS